MSTLRERYEQSKRRWGSQSTLEDSRRRRPYILESYSERYEPKIPRNSSPIRPLTSSRFAPTLPQQYLMSSSPTATSYQSQRVSEVKNKSKGLLLRLGEYFNRDTIKNATHSIKTQPNPNHKKRVWFAEETNDADTNRIEEERNKRLKISYEQQISSMEDELERRSKEVDQTQELLKKANAQLTSKINEIEESYERNKLIAEENEKAGLRELENSLRLREEALNVKAAALDQQQRNLDFERLEFERTKREFERAKMTLVNIQNNVHNGAKSATREKEIKHDEKSDRITFENITGPCRKAKSLNEHRNDIIQHICHNEGQLELIIKVYSSRKSQPEAFKSVLQVDTEEHELEAKYQKALFQLDRYRFQTRLTLQQPEVQNLLSKLNTNFMSVFHSLDAEVASLNNKTFQVDLILASPETAIEKFESRDFLEEALNLIKKKKRLLYEMKLVNDLLLQISDLTARLDIVNKNTPKTPMLTSTPRYFSHRK